MLLVMGGTSSCCDLKIYLDRHWYAPGSVAKGYIDIKIPEDTHIGDVEAEVTGESIIYSNHQTLCKFDQTIYKSHGVVLKAGTHTFPFVFEVPSQGTPSTFHAKNGDVTYAVKIKTLVGKCKKEFWVTSKRDELMEEPDEETAVHSTFLRNGIFIMEVILHRTGYLPGETITVLLEMSRAQTLLCISISPFVTIELVAAVRCKELKGFLTSKVTLIRRRTLFPRMGRISTRQHIHIPQDIMPSTSFENSFETPMELNYYLNVALSSKEVQIPIKIGKRRIRELDFNRAQVETWTTV